MNSKALQSKSTALSKLYALLMLAPISNVSAATIYAELFSNGFGTGVGQNGWLCSAGTASDIPGNTGNPVGLVAVNSGFTGTAATGFVRAFNGPRQLFATSEFPIPLADYTLDTISFTVGNNTTTDAFRVAVKINGVWYASDSTFTSSVAVTASSAFAADATARTLTLAGSTWKTFTLTGQTAHNTGTITAPTGASVPLPTTGTVESFGLVESSVLANTARFDSFVINATRIGLSKYYWGAGSGVWDTTTANWQLDGAGGLIPYVESNLEAYFNDNTTANPATITLAADHTPPTVTVNSTKNYTFAGAAIAGEATLTKTGTSTLTLANANTFTGGTTINDGTVKLANQNALQASTVKLNSATAALAFDSAVVGNAFTLGGLDAALAGPGFDLTLANTASAPVALTVGANNASTTYAGVLGGAGSLVKAGTGTLTLTGVNTLTGATTVNAGTLLATATANLPGYASAAKVVFNGGTLGLQVGGAGWATTEVDTLLANATKTAGALGLDTTNGSLAQWTPFTATNFGGALGLTKLGANTLTLSGTNSYLGATAIQAGTLELVLSGDIALSTASVVGNSGSALAVGTSSTTGSVASILQFTPGSDTANYTVARGLNLNQGTSSALAGVNFNGDGAGDLNTNGLTLAGDLALGARGSRLSVQRAGQTLHITGNITQAVGAAGDLNLNNFPADPGVDGHGPGTIRFSNVARDYSAANLLIAGRVVIDGVVGAVNTPGPIGRAALNLAVSSGGNIVGGGNFVVGADTTHDTSPDTVRAVFLGTDGGGYARNISLGLGSQTVVASYGSNVAVINGYQFGGLNTTGTVTFSGNLVSTDIAVGGSLTNPITLVANIALSAESGGTAAFTGVISDSPSATTNARVTINQFRNHPNLDGVNETLGVVGADGVADTAANQLIGAAKTGTVVLGGANTYEGGTEVLGGTLLVTNTTGSATGAGAVTIATGATLGGTGGIAGEVTVPAGATLAPGAAGVGTLTVNNNAILAGTYAVQLDGLANGDVLAVNGNLDLTGATLAVSALGGGASGTYVIATYTGTLTGTFGTVPPGYTVDYATTGQIKLTAPAATSLIEIWRTTNFPGSTATTGAGANNADADNDGLANLVEYALGTDAKVANATPVAVVRDVSGVLKLSFPHIADATVVYTVKATNDLVAGFGATAVGSFTGFTSTGTTDYLDSGFPLASNPKRFLRLEVTAP